MVICHISWLFAIFHGYLPYFMVICHISWLFDIFHGYLTYFQMLVMIMTNVIFFRTLGECHIYVNFPDRVIGKVYQLSVNTFLLSFDLILQYLIIIIRLVFFGFITFMKNALCP